MHFVLLYKCQFLYLIYFFLAGYLQVKPAVPGEQFQHVVQEPHTRADLACAFTVQIQEYPDIRLPGFANDFRLPHLTFPHRS